MSLCALSIICKIALVVFSSPYNISVFSGADNADLSLEDDVRCRFVDDGFK
jgi:hypothetical protein